MKKLFVVFVVLLVSSLALTVAAERGSSKNGTEKNDRAIKDLQEDLSIEKIELKKLKEEVDALESLGATITLSQLTEFVDRGVIAQSTMTQLRELVDSGVITSSTLVQLEQFVGGGSTTNLNYLSLIGGEEYWSDGGTFIYPMNINSYFRIYDNATLYTSGPIYAPSYSGIGSAITSLNASELSSGLVPAARVTGSYTGITRVGTLNDLSVTGSPPISMIRTSSGQWINMADGTDIFGVYNNAGTPETVIAANIGSLAIDSAGGMLYIKTTDAVATGWSAFGLGPGNTLQQAYDIGNLITTTDARDIDFVLANTVTDSNFDVDIADGSAGTVSISRLNGAGVVDPAQLLLLENLDLDRAVAVGLNFSAAAGGFTSAIDASGINITNALSLGTNAILGTTADIDLTFFDVIGASGNIVTAGDLAVNGGNITSSTGALTVTPLAGTNLNVALTAPGNFTVNATDLVVETATGNVGIGTVSPGAKLMVDGTADEIQLLVQGNATQNTDIFVVEDSGGVDVFTISQYGSVDVKPRTNADALLVDGGNVDNRNLLRLKSFNEIDDSDPGILNIEHDRSSGLTGNITGVHVDMITTQEGSGFDLVGLDVIMNNDTNSVGLRLDDMATEIEFVDTTSTIAMANTGTLSFTDGTNTLMTLADGGAAGNLTVMAQGDMRFADSDSSHYVGFQATDTVTANVIWTLPAADGTANQVLETDGSGALSWATIAGGAGAFSTTANVTSNAPGDLTLDDFVFGSDQLDDDGVATHDNRMFFDKSKGAFRAGGVATTQWNDVNRGLYSFATGYNSRASGGYSIAMGYEANASNSYATAIGRDTIASGQFSTALGYSTAATGDYSTAMGYNTAASWFFSTALGRDTTASGNVSTAMGFGTIASADNSTAMGQDTIASGNVSTAMGQETTAQAYASLVLGRYNLISGTTLSWVATDPVFVIGNGTSAGSPSNAMTVLKDGKTGIGRTPTVNTLEVEGNASKTTATSWLANSDRRIKNSIGTISSGLEVIDKLNPVRFKYNDDYMAQHPSIKDHYYYGFIAQEFQDVFPDSVQDDGTGYLQIDTYNVRPYLVKAIQEQQEQISLLQNGIGEIETNIEENTLAISDMGTILSERQMLSESTGTIEPNSEFLALLDELAIRLDVVEAQLAANDTATIDSASSDYQAPGEVKYLLPSESSGTIDQNNNYMALIDRLTARMDEMEASQAERDYQAQIDAQQAEIEELTKQNSEFKKQNSEFKKQNSTFKSRLDSLEKLRGD